MTIAAYQTNLEEAAAGLRAAETKLLIFKQQELIYRDEKQIVRAKNAAAAQVYCEWLRWNSDWHHWASRLRMAQQEAGALVTVPSEPNQEPVQQDLRLPRERDEDAPF